MIWNVNQLSPEPRNGDFVCATYKFKTLLTPYTFFVLQTAQRNRIVFKGVQICLQKWFVSAVSVTGPNLLLTMTVSKVKFSRYRPGVAQRVGRSIALLFYDRGTRRGWMVSNTPRPHFTTGKDQVPILQEAGWAPGPIWTGGKSRPHRDSIPDLLAPSQSLYRLSYRAHNDSRNVVQFTKYSVSFNFVFPCIIV